jgi:hypothetical protein
MIENIKDRIGKAKNIIQSASASQDGVLIEKAKRRLGVFNDNENRLWIEAMLMHLDTPLSANVILTEDHPLFNQQSLKLLVTAEDAQKTLDTLLFQPVDMRWDGTGHEREKLGTTNGVRAFVADAEIRNDNELWVAICFWMKEFLPEAMFLVENLPYIGMSVDLDAEEVVLSEAFPSTVVFHDPHFYGGTLMFKTLAADKQTRIGALAHDETEEKIKMAELDLEKVYAMLADKDKQVADNFKLVIDEKDKAILQRDTIIESLKTSPVALASAKDAVREEVEKELKASFEEDKNKAIQTALATEQEKNEETAKQIEILNESVKQVQEKLADAEKQRDEALAEIKKRDDEIQQEKLYNERINVLNEIHQYGENELTDEVKQGVATASEEQFKTLKLERELVKLRAEKTNKSDAEEDGVKKSGSAHASFKNVDKETNLTDIQELAKEFAKGLS